VEEHVMFGLNPQEMIARELQQAVELLHRDMERVEFWADALGHFSTPIPDYEASDSRLDEFMLPPRRGKDERDAPAHEAKI
jgi:hypothetical protein